MNNDPRFNYVVSFKNNASTRGAGRSAESVLISMLALICLPICIENKNVKGPMLYPIFFFRSLFSIPDSGETASHR